MFEDQMEFTALKRDNKTMHAGGQGGEKGGDEKQEG